MVDDISPGQLDLPTHALRFLALEQDHKKLLTPENIQEVIDNPEDFIP